MYGILAVNHFLRGKKFSELHSHLISSAEKSNIKLELCTNLHLSLTTPKADFVLFWDKDTVLARRLEKDGVPVFNSAKSIELCDNKALTYLTLDGKVEQPKTLISPLTFYESDMSEFVDGAVDILSLPLVFKECCGSFGEQVFLCKTKAQIMSHITTKPFILQEFVSQSAGRDVRIEVIDGECASAVLRENKNDFRSNVTNGGVMKVYEPTDHEKQIATTACNELGLTFGGVDILSNGMLCEVNSNAHIINIMHTNGIDIAPKIFNAIKKRLI